MRYSLKLLMLSLSFILMIGSADATTLTSSAGNNILIGQNDIFTATATLSIDTAQLLINGVLECSATNSCTYNVNSLTPTGNYNVTARDITGGIVQTQNTLVINAVPSGIIYFVNRTITNNQNTNTVNGLPIKVGVNSQTNNQVINGILLNSEFFYFNGTIIPSWLESGATNAMTNSVYWLKINPQIKWSGNSLTIYQGYGTLNNNMFSKSNTGESPTLSSQYGQFDSGANVFSFYDNFFGTSLSITPSTWNANVKNSIETWAISNGLVITKGTATKSWFGIVSNVPYATTNSYIFEGLVNGYSSTGGTPGIIFAESKGLTFDTTQPATYTPAYGGEQSNTNAEHGLFMESSGTVTLTTEVFTDPIIIGVSWAGTGVVNSIINYNSIATSNSGIAYTSNVYFSIDTSGGTQSVSANVQWARARFIPPSGIFPANSVSQLMVVPTSTTPTLKFSAGNSIVYNTNDVIEADCFPNTDNCAIQQNGIVVSNAIDLTTFNANVLAVNNYAFSANDLTSGINSIVNTLVVTQATPLITFPLEPSSYTYNGVGGQFTASINTYNSQLAANDYIGSVVVTQFFTTNTYVTSSAVATYTITANTLGNANYIATSNSFTFNINQNAPLSMTFSTGNSILYGAIDLITVTGSPSTEPTNIIIGNTQYAFASGVTAYSICGSSATIYNCIAVGTYLVQGCDTNSNTCITNTLVISGATPVLSFPIFPSSYTFNGFGAQIQAKIATVSNQINGNLYFSSSYVFNSLKATSNTLANDTSPIPPDTYTYIFNSLQSGNYLASSLTKSFSITNGGGGGSSGQGYGNCAWCIFLPPRLPLPTYYK